MKKLILFFTVVAIVLSFSGCSLNKTASIHEKVQKMLTELESYEADTTITRISNKGENTYGAKQWYLISGEYKMEMVSPEDVAGNYTIYNGSKVCQYNPKMNTAVAIEVEENQARNELFLGQFIKNYLKSEDVVVNVVENLEEGTSTVLEAIIPGNYKYTATEKLWVDNKTILPTRLVIYDTDGNERYIIEYNEFVYNGNIDPKVFEITN